MRPRPYQGERARAGLDGLDVAHHDGLYERDGVLALEGGAQHVAHVEQAGLLAAVPDGRGLNSFTLELNLSSSVHRVTQINS